MAKLNWIIPTSLLVFAILTKGSQIGDRCTEDKECDSYTNNHFVCKNQQSCNCKIGYHPLLSKDGCQAAINTVCKDREDCSSLPNSECNKEGICECRADFTSSYDNMNCLQRATNIGDPCQEPKQCSMTFGEQSMCDSSGRCTCIEGHHSSQKEPKCIKNVGLGGICTTDEDCYLEESKGRTIQCKTGKCDCRDGFEFNEPDGQCIASGNIVAASILTLAACVMLRLFA